jgi:Ribonuclease P 40kDa (Rpp40) subunit
MHTIDTYLDTEDVAIIDGDGHLVLSLQKETYEAFGLEGKAATFTGNGRRYSEYHDDGDQYLLRIKQMY